MKEITKAKLKGMICGFILGAVFFSAIGYAAMKTDLYDVEMGEIKIFIDESRIHPTDVNGNTVEPFIYNGTTYLPVRAMAEAFGFDVEWNEDTTSVYVYTDAESMNNNSSHKEDASSGGYDETSDDLDKIKNNKKEDDYKYDDEVEDVNKKGFVRASSGAGYTYDISMGVPSHDGYSEGYSSCEIFRDIFISEYGRENAYLYDTMLDFALELLYNDTIDYCKTVKVTGFDDDLDMDVISAAVAAVEEDYPFVSLFVHINVQGSPNNYNVTAKRDVINYFSDDFKDSQEGYIWYRDTITEELEEYRELAEDYDDEKERVIAVGEKFIEDAEYDLSAPYHILEAFIYKRGVCSTANSAFTIICQAVDVPAYTVSLESRDHMVSLVKLKGEPLRVVDATFGIKGIEFKDVSDGYYDDVYEFIVERGCFENILFEHYFPNSDILEVLGGLS